jgi:probable rRNA maturation factor
MPISVRSPRSLAGLAPALRALVRAALRSEGRRAGEIGVLLADDATLRSLNHAYRGLDRATDVLSFAYDEGQSSGSGRLSPVHGDLVVSMDRVHEQARRFRVTPGEELARLVVHGTLHLAGLDHRHAAERRDMRRREDRALRAGAVPVRALARSRAAGYIPGA